MPESYIHPFALKPLIKRFIAIERMGRNSSVAVLVRIIMTVVIAKNSSVVTGMDTRVDIGSSVVNDFS